MTTKLVGRKTRNTKLNVFFKRNYFSKWAIIVAPLFMFSSMGRTGIIWGQSGLINSIYTLSTSHPHTGETNGVCKPGNTHGTVVFHNYHFVFYILTLFIP